MNETTLYEDHAYEKLKRVILEWPRERTIDTYAIALLYSSGASADAEGREIGYQAVISLYYNTLSHHHQKSVTASDSTEARRMPGY